MTFTYRVKDKSGKTVNGTLQTDSIDAAVKILKEREVTIIDVHEQTSHIETPSTITALLHHVGFGEVVDFTRQLSTMIVAGLPLIDSLNLLASQSKTAFKEVVESIILKIRGGSTFATALTEHPQQFSKIYTALILAGERSGKLDIVLERLADNLEKQRSFKSKIKTAMIYPTSTLPLSPKKIFAG